MFHRRALYLTLWYLCLTLTGCQSLSPISPSLAGRCSDPLSDDAVAASLNVTLERLHALKRARSLTNSELCRLPEAALRRVFNRLDHPKAEHPAELSEFRDMQRRSADGKVKADGLIKGIEHRKQMLRKKKAETTPLTVAPEGGAAVAAGGELMTAGAGVSRASWIPLGPGNIGGRIRAVLIDPTNTSSIWVGSVSGGIWHSSDDGNSWSPVNDFMATLAISSLIMEPGNPSVLYAGTGEGFVGNAARGAGVFKSTDGGITWNHLASTTPSSDQYSDAYNWYSVNRLAISGDGATLLAATKGAGNSAGGIYRSADGGATWSLVYSGAKVWDVKFDPNDANKAIATTTGMVGGQWQSLLLRTLDGGRTWSVALNFANSTRMEVCYAKSDSGIVYISRDNVSGEIWKSADGGATWNKLSTPQHLGNQGWYDNAIWVDPTNPLHVVTGGLDIWRSIDGGVTWTKISSSTNNTYGYPNVPHADQHVLVSDPDYNGTTNKRLYNANDGGLFRAQDISLATQNSGWESLNRGLAITQFYSGAGRTSAGGKIIGGTQDNGSLERTGIGTDWRVFFGGDGGFSAVDSQDGNYLYGELIFLQIFRTITGQGTSLIYNGISDAGTSKSNFISPFILDPNDNNRMLAGGSSLWQSLTVKAPVPAWTVIKEPYNPGYNITAIAIAEGNSSITWVAHGSVLFRSSDSLAATPTWTSVGSTRLPSRIVNRILIDREDPNRVYVAFGGYDADNLYRTTDNGATWTDVSGNLPEVPIFAIARHPGNANRLYAGTEVGLFTSEDGGATWSTSDDGPSGVEISELTWLDDATLLAATFGRGMFMARVPSDHDTTPPTVTSATPAAGATGVSSTTPISATFSEPMDATSFTTSSFTLDHGVTGTVNYDPITMTATFTPNGSLANATTYTATISSAAVDVAGNPLSTTSWSFTTAAAEGFSTFGSFPSGWSVVDNAGTGKVWSTGSSKPRSNNTGGTGSFAIADSDAAGNFRMDTELRSPVFNLSGYTSATLSFKTDFFYYVNDVADVDVSSNGAAGPWTNVWRKTASYRGPKTETIDLSAVAAGKAKVMFRFHYYNANYSWYWEVDDVSLTGSQNLTPAVRLLNPAAVSYQGLQTAYNNAASGNTIQAQAGTFVEDLILGNPIALLLRGGYDSSYSSNSSFTTISGSLKVRNGSVRIDGFRFR